MEEVDKIIIHSLRQVGCDIEEEVESLKQFSTDLVINAAVRCLDMIQPGLGLPHSLPPSMSARFRLGASIAQTCIDLGYTGDVGYQTFLYPGESEVRRVLMFLIEKLPKESQKTVVEPADPKVLLEKEVAAVIRKQLSSPWLPSFCKRKGVRWRDDGTWSREGCGDCYPFITGNVNIPRTNDKVPVSQAFRQYYVHYLPAITDQLSESWKLLPSLIVMYDKEELKDMNVSVVPSGDHERPKLLQIISDNVLNVSQNFAENLERRLSDVPVEARKIFKKPQSINEDGIQSLEDQLRDQKLCDQSEEKETTEKGSKRKSENEIIEDMKKETSILKESLEKLQIEVKKLTAKFSQINEEFSREKLALKETEDRYAIKLRTYDLLPEGESNLTKLQILVENSAQKLVNLAAQWEKHRVPLVEDYRNTKERNSNKASESRKQADAVKGLRDKVKELGDELKNKEQLQAQLLAEYEKVTKDVSSISRSAYTRRIMEIIGNIRKQKEEIDKVLKDTKELQKEMNNLTGRLDRSFTVADELIFKDAKKDDVSRRAYKLLATLHSDCSELVQMVEETGATVREIRDLEEQIDIESAKNVGANLERVSADLRQMKQENAALTAQLKLKSQRLQEQ